MPAPFPRGSKVRFPVLRAELDPLISRVVLVRPHSGVPDALQKTAGLLRLQRDTADVDECEVWTPISTAISTEHGSLLRS